jgi:subtilase family serine protease
MHHRPWRRLIRVPILAALVCAALTGGFAPPAGATPLSGLLNGPLVDLGCANPANHGVVDRVLGAAHLSVGGPLRCFGKVLATAPGQGARLMPGPVGLGPSQIQSAYGLSGLSAGGRTVAIVDAYDDPNAASDLAQYRQASGLAACGAGCFTKVNQNGAASPLPAPDAGWAEEISLDLDAVSAACPSCHILLVEANSQNTPDLLKAEDTAASTPGVASVSNSWGGAEDKTILADDSHFNHPGVAITAASGDTGYGVNWPASSPFVTAVGGTTLSAGGGARGWTETAWSGAGSGCSAFEAKPSWQTDPGCPKRTVADVSADADPGSGLGIYDTYNDCLIGGPLCDLLIQLGLTQGLDGWTQAGGTSLSSPLVAAVYALAPSSAGLAPGYSYGHAAALNDVTGGANGSCSPAYLCTAGPGYDGPTGLGTPAGTGAF